MAFVNNRRSKQSDDTTPTEQKVINTTESIQQPLTPLQESLKVLEDVKIEDDETRKKKFYTEQSKHVLNIMEQQGIDFYDDSRYGGMYLKSKTEQRQNNSLVSQLVNKLETKNTQNTKEDLINRLLAKSSKSKEIN